MKTIVVALLLAPLPIRAAQPTASQADTYLANEIADRLERLTCDCTCLDEAKVLHNARVILRQDTTTLPDLGDEGSGIDHLRAEKRCDSKTSGRGSAAATPSKSGSTTSVVAVSGNPGDTKMTLPESVTNDDFVYAFGKLDPRVREKLSDSLVKKPNPSLADALSLMDEMQRQTFVGALPCAAQQALNEPLVKPATPPGGLSADDFGLAMGKLDPYARATLVEKLKTPNHSLADALAALDDRQRRTFIAGLPCAAQQLLNDSATKQGKHK